MGLNRTAFPRFEAGQILTADDLNALVDWIDEESRKHRLRATVSLAVIAIVIAVLCGSRRKC